MFRTSSGGSDTPDYAATFADHRRLRRQSPSAPQSPLVLDDGSPAFRRKSPPLAAPVDVNSWHDRVLGRRQKILDDLSVVKEGPRTPLSQSFSATLPSLAASYRSSPLSASLGAAASVSPLRRLDADLFRPKAPAILKPLGQALNFSDTDQKTERLLEKADEVDLILESATKELEEMKEEFRELRTELDRSQDDDDDILLELQELRRRKLHSRESSRPSSTSSHTDSITQARHDLIRDELLKMKLNLLKDSEHSSSSSTGPAPKSEPSCSNASKPTFRSSSIRSPLKARANISPYTYKPCTPVTPPSPFYSPTASLSAALSQCPPRPGTSLLNDLMSDWRPVTAPTRTAQVNRFQPREQDLFLLLGRLRSLACAEAHWPLDIAKLYARMNFCLAHHCWDDLVQMMTEGMALTYEEQPASLFLCTHGDVLCVLTTTFDQEAVCALLWNHLFCTLSDIGLRESSQPSSSAQDICEAVDAKQRALLDEDFVEQVLENVLDVGLKRRVKGLIAGLAGMLVQRDRLDPHVWHRKCQDVFARFELRVPKGTTLIPTRRKAWLWTADDVADWLAYQGFVEYGKVFLDNEADGYTLLNLAMSDMEDLTHELTRLRTPGTGQGCTSSEGWFAGADDATPVRFFNQQTAPLQAFKTRPTDTVTSDLPIAALTTSSSSPEIPSSSTAHLSADQYHILLINTDVQCNAMLDGLRQQFHRRGIRDVTVLQGQQLSRATVATEVDRLCATLQPDHSVLVWCIGESKMPDDACQGRWMLPTGDAKGDEGLTWHHFQPFVEAVKGQPKDSGLQVSLVFDVVGTSIEFSRADVDQKNSAALFPPSHLAAASSVQAVCSVFPRHHTHHPGQVQFFTALAVNYLAKQKEVVPLHQMWRQLTGDWQAQGLDCMKHLQLVRLLGAGDMLIAPPQ